MGAVSNSNIVGFVVGQILDNAPFLSPDKFGYGAIMVVARDHQRQGIGDALWKATKDWFSRKGIVEVQTFTECGNVSAETFWENRGFTPYVNRRRHCIGKRQGGQPLTEDRMD